MSLQVTTRYRASSSVMGKRGGRGEMTPTATTTAPPPPLLLLLLLLLTLTTFTPPQFLVVHAWTWTPPSSSSRTTRLVRRMHHVAPELDSVHVAQVHRWVDRALGDEDDNVDEKNDKASSSTNKKTKKDDRYATVRALSTSRCDETKTEATTPTPTTGDEAATTTALPHKYHHQLVYGELSVPVLATILNAVGVHRNDRFLDIGSGDGGLVYGAALLYPPAYLSKVRGIELVPALVQRSQTHGHTLQQQLHNANEDDEKNDNATASWLTKQDRIEFAVGNVYEAETDTTVQRILQDTTLAICFATTWSQGNNDAVEASTASPKSRNQNENSNKISLNRRQLPQLSQALQYLPDGARIVVVDGRLLEDTLGRDGHSCFEWQGDLKIQCPDTAPYSVASLYVRRHDDTKPKVSNVCTPTVVPAAAAATAAPAAATPAISPSPPLATNRRQLLSRAAMALMAGATASSGLTYYQPAWAAGAPSSAVVATSTRATCDGTVSVWQRGNRFIYLLGTAHISEQSAALAGQLVRDTHPGAVFVELDLRRVAGVSSRDMEVDNQTGIVSTRLALDVNGDAGSRVVIPQITPVSERPDAVDLRVLARGGTSATTTTAPALGASGTTNNGGVLMSPESSTTTPTTSRRTSSKPNFFQSKLTDWGAALVGKAIRGLYASLGQQGFSPGEEFVTAVKEGQAMGSDIVLGDQDVQVTLRRLSQALAVTDLDALTDPNSNLERSMAELFGGSNTSPPPTTGEKSAAEMKEELTAFVEAMKSRDKVRQIMGELRQVAPALVQVMLTERDTYMAAGLDSLQNYQVITAVMGLAHQDGVERNLQAFGWTPVKLNCPLRARP